MIFISGDGGSGSSYLVWLLRDLGFSTCPSGYELPDLPTGEPVTFELLREKRIQDNFDKIDWSTVEVIKHLGGFCFNLHEWVDRFNWKVDHVFIVTRGLEEGIRRRKRDNHVLKRQFLQLDANAYALLSDEQKDDRARKVVRERIGAAVLQCVDRNYPFTILPFPKFVREPGFLFNAIEPILKYDCDYFEFLEVYEKITDLNKVVTY